MIHQNSIIKVHTKKEITITKLILGVLLIFASNQLLIPIKPVPITLLTVSISLIGLTYSPKLGFLTMATYILAGMSGLPMFAGLKSGVMHFFGPSGGYLVGNLIAVPVMGWLKNKFTNDWKGISAICLVGHAIIYLLGVGWLSTFVGINSAIHLGFIIFIPSGLIKISIFSILFSYVTKKL